VGCGKTGNRVNGFFFILHYKKYIMKLFTRLALTLIVIHLLNISSNAQVRSIVPDSTFGINGFVSNPYNAAYTSPPLAMDVQSSGKIIQAIVSNTSIVSLRRYTSDGMLDSTFGTNGYTIINPLGSYYNQGVIIKVLGNDNILICAGVYPAQTYITRVTAAGAIDSTFGSSGTGYTALGAYYHINMNILSDGTIRIIVNNLTSIYDTALLIKTNANGIIDSSFGTNGGIYLPYYINGTSLDHSDRIVVSVNGSIVFRILPNGMVDNTFGINGYTTIIVDTALTNYLRTPSTTPTALPDNSIVVILKYVAGGGVTYYAVHLSQNGTLDTTYGNNGGLAATVYGYYDATPTAVVVDNGEVLLVGQEIDQSSSIYDAGIMSVLNTAGQPDSVFLNHLSSKIYIQYDTTIGNQITYVGPTIVLPGGRILEAGAYYGFYTWLAKYDYSGFVAGIADVRDNMVAALYPNPSSSQCTLRIANGDGEKYTAQLVGMAGEKVGEQWDVVGGSSVFSISHYAKGIYMLRITDSKGGQSVKKLVVE
jgi:uncharacterized delta-60 repeat protein